MFIMIGTFKVLRLVAVLLTLLIATSHLKTTTSRRVTSAEGKDDEGEYYESHFRSREKRQADFRLQNFNSLVAPDFSSSSNSDGIGNSNGNGNGAGQLNGQCPIFADPNYQLNSNGRLQSQNDRVRVDPETGKRTFDAKIVGIFSCLDQGGPSSSLAARGSLLSSQSSVGTDGTGVGGGGGAAAAHSASSDLTLDFRLAKPVIDLAVAAVNAKYSQHIKFNVTYRTAGDICRRQQAAGHAADEYYVNGANYFVGPGCSESLASVGQLASYWNVPICSTGYLPEMITARFRPLTLFQLSLSVQSVGEMLLELFQMYKWRHLVIVTDEKHPLHSLIRDGLLEFFSTMYRTSGGGGSGSGHAHAGNVAGMASQETPAGHYSEQSAGHQQQQPKQQQQQHPSSGQQQARSNRPYYINITTRDFSFSKHPSGHDSGGGGGGDVNVPPDYEQVMLEAASMSRIMLFLARSSTIQHLLEAAHAQDMSRGQFVFIAHELFETQAFESGGSSGTGSGASSRNEQDSQQQGGNNKQQQQHLQHENSMDESGHSDDEDQLPPGGGGGIGDPQHHQKYALDEKIEIHGKDRRLMHEIFQPLMTISLRIPTTPELDNFRSQVVGLSEREFNYRLQPSSLKSLYSLGLAAFIYDCVLLYADKVNFILNQTQFSRVDGKTLFDMTAGKTFRGALTGDLTINRAGQRVIDFTLNDFSPRTLTLEPIAHFYAIERRLTFLAGKAPHWTLRNQSTPRSDPRCRVNDTAYCRYAADEDLSALAASRSDRVVLGVWLVTIIISSVAITSSIIGWLVYRRFRIESELLNLWWSIKYEDIIFEDDNEQLICDGKRSLSSLAISNESYNVGAGGGGGGGGGADSYQRSGVATPAEGKAALATSSAALTDHLACPSNSGSNGAHSTTNAGVVMQLSVSPPLGAGSDIAAGTSAPDFRTTDAGLLSGAHSASSLSVGGGSALGVSVAGNVCGQSSQSHAASATNIGGSSGTTRGTGSSSAAHFRHHQSASHKCDLSSSSSGAATGHQRRYALSTSSGGASKLIPLLSGGGGGGSSSNSSAGKSGNRSHAATGSGSQKGAAATTAATTTTTKSSSANVIGLPSNVACSGGGVSSLSGAAGLGSGGGGGGGGGANAKDPSISSQNKNIKLRLGTVLNGRDQAHMTKVGLYKASKVAAKHLNVRNLNINRQLLIELRQVRDLTHENLIKFIGLCPEEPNVAIVSELCTRGNLQDLLQNETIRLDWPFRFSIINDIVDGLTHLHSSPVQYHGRLKSSNCVIDNRFVVKLTDFGLPTLLAAVEMDGGSGGGGGNGNEGSPEVNPRLLLWTAPEHLRTKYPLLSGSQKGDIYSLAIIFQEIITRCGPFECEPILCGSSEVGVPADLLAQQQQLALQQQQQQALPPPMIRTTDYTTTGGGGGNSGASRSGALQRTRGGRGGTPTGPIRNSHLNLHHHHQQQQQQQQHSQPQSQLPQQQQQMQMQQMQFLQPIVVQHKQRLEPEEIVNLVRMGLSPPFRPYFRPDAFLGGGQTADFNVSDLIAIVQSCWQESPAARPSVTSVKQQIKKLRRGCHLDGANLMDNLLQRMERYTDNLESLVEQKTAELMEEKKRSEELLYEMLPRFVVDQLRYGHSVTPEAYDAVTISFSDIKDFTSIAAQSSPIEVVNLLNQLYTEFDDCIARYDVYKVETIGDAYMVVSGLPIRNGDLHAKEIAEMSLALLELIGNFEVAHLPDVKLELRIGIHSGPCASGVVGTRMFRYCLFGDTVNTASRMESHGEPMKIHISEDSANILARFRTFVIEPRGQVDIKGKGLMSTYWLTGKKSSSVDS